MKKIISIFVLQLLAVVCCSQVIVKNLLTENRTNPIGIDAVKPRFSWQLFSDKRNVLQTAYEIKLLFGKEMYWTSGKIDSDQSVQVSYAGMELQSGETYSWQ